MPALIYTLYIMTSQSRQGLFFLNIGLLFHCVQPVEQIHFLSLVQQSKDIYYTKINQLIYFNVSISRCLKLLTNFC